MNAAELVSLLVDERYSVRDRARWVIAHETRRYLEGMGTGASLAEHLSMRLSAARLLRADTEEDGT